MVRLEQQKSIIGMQFVLTFEFCSNEVPGAAVDTLKSANFACPVSGVLGPRTDGKKVLYSGHPTN